MKSFATQIRDAITRDQTGGRDVAGREPWRPTLAGLLLACGSVTIQGNGELGVTLQFEHAGTNRWAVLILRDALNVNTHLRIVHADRLGGRTAYQVRLEGGDATTLLHTLSITPLTQSIPAYCLKTKRARNAFLRGMFLGCGTIADPAKAYHMDFHVSTEKMAWQLSRFLQSFYGIHANATMRRNQWIVYSKDSDSIIAALSAMGAYSAILAYENARITKEARNHANRATNCDNGNIGKTLGAAERQLEAIALIERTIGIEALPDSLQEIAIERKFHPAETLEGLGALLDPPVGKSGVHHRLNRIEALARSIALNEKEGNT